MLSQQIYDSWNAQTTADLEDLLANINGPGRYIPKDIRSSIFKQQVLEKIEKRRLESYRNREQRIEHLEEDKSKSYCPCFSRRNDRELKNECKTMSTFENFCSVSTKVFSKSISTVKALIQKLSYWESIKPGTDGLSVIGGYMWLLSFACQHLIDCPNFKDHYRMQVHMADVKEKYQELGQAGELFTELAESFHQNTFHMRGDGLLILKRLTKRWSISEEKNPLYIRPETLKNIPRPRKRLGIGLDSTFDTDDDDDVFSVKWTPLTVFIQMSSKESPKPFGKLHPQDRVTIFRKFLQCTLDKVEMAAEDLTLISNQISSIGLDNNKVMEGRDITYAMLSFSKSKNVPKTLSDNDRKKMIFLLNEFWYSLDVLQENVYILLRLVQETRDIIRTCYVYTDLFYKWNMPNYDSYIPKNKMKQPRISKEHAKDILHKIGHPMGNKKLSETTSIMSLMDFSSSIYQGVLQEIPIQCDEMLLRLRMNELESNDEPMGLVSGMIDKRKSCLGMDGCRKSFQ